MSQVQTWEVTGFHTPAESVELAGKVIDLLSNWDTARTDIEVLKRYLRQDRRYTVSEGRDIESKWNIYESAKRQKARRFEKGKHEN